MLAALVAGSAMTAVAQPLYFSSDASGNLLQAYTPTATAPVIVHQPASRVAATGDPLRLAVLARGAIPLSYQWQLNSNNIPGATADTLIIPTIASTDFGAYRVIVTNPLGSITSSNALVQLDADRDGLADAWEILHFTSITNRSGFADYDQDGATDREEFVEGTHPRFASSSVNPRLQIISDRGEVFVSPNLPFFAPNQIVTLNGVPDPGQQFLGYLRVPFGGGPYLNIHTNPAELKLGTSGLIGSQIVRAIFGLPIPQSLDVTNGWRIDQAGWYGQSSVTHDGADAAQSMRMLGAFEAWMELTNVVLSAEGTIRFWWKVDGTPQDRLRFHRNGLLRSGEIGTNTDWQLRTYYLPKGTNVVRWVYKKGGNEVSEYNGLVYAPADAGWVDEVTYSVWPDPDLDADGDTLADIWELKFFDELSPRANDDSDRDGITNRDEFIEGTDPTSNVSLLPRLTVVASGGTVTRNPHLPKFTFGQTVQLQAVPEPNNYFVVWSGAVSGTDINRSLVMNANKAVTATFGLPLPVVLNTPALNWTRHGTIGFFGQTNVSHDGLHAAQSGPVGFREESAMETTVTGPGTLVFWWKPLCQTNVNFGRFLIDGVEQAGKITGDMPWRPQSFYVGEGAHTFRWNYTNNVGNFSLTNGIWVDRVSFTPGMIAPSIAIPPVPALVASGETARFEVIATGTLPFTYQWFRNNVSLGGAGTQAVLTLANVSSSDAGSYRVEVGNPMGTVSSGAAGLTVVPVPPVNDDFANRTPAGGPAPMLGYTWGATSEEGEPDHGLSFGGRSVWWSWTAPASGTYWVQAVATNLNHPLAAAVYTGNSVGALTEVRKATGNPITSGGVNLSPVAVPFAAVSGTQYAVAIDHEMFASAFFSISIGPAPAPSLGSVVVGTGNGFGFSFAAPAGARYEIHVSTNLVIWMNMDAGTVPPDGRVLFVDLDTDGEAIRFYRAILVP